MQIKISNQEYFLKLYLMKIAEALEFWVEILTWGTHFLNQKDILCWLAYSHASGKV